ncbi:SH3 domain-containing protein [Streptomyces sp. NBC_01497]|uniref:SH3 domain-containing protein n=1 Tax=Streptomyces sp. NBC_01497 TaxID=2903885 RepID=UPI002E373873|nr:SH3 domain-containing protein [Streptomyces sp. NBC_01497]
MPLRSLGFRATTLAAITLTAAAVLTTVPAAADGSPADHTTQGPQTQHVQPVPVTSAASHEQAAVKPPARGYKGRVIARGGLYLRDKPTRSSRVIGFARYGTVVHIFCKTRGDNVAGDNRWYLLTDGTWAWGSARYIENIGAAPRWC